MEHSEDQQTLENQAPSGAEVVQEIRCPNCQKKQKGSYKYCPKCGQRNTTHRVSFKILLIDFFREELHLNNKAFRTLKLLFTDPGALTLAYIKGEKKSMLTPTKLFIWSGFLLIAMLLPTTHVLDIKSGGGPIRFNVGPYNSESSQTSGNSTLFKDSIQQINAAPKQFLEKLLRRFPFVLLTILPLFALVLKLLYRKRNMYFVEHMVFLLHFHSVAFIMLSILLAIMLLFPGFIMANKFILGGIFIYALLAFKKVYRHGWSGTLFRGSLLVLLYLITVPLILILSSLGISLLV